MRFWLDMGVDGMRLDAVPYLVEREGTQCANLPETHAILKAIRRELDSRHPGRMLLAEANQWPSDVRAYFGDGDECHMAFHFPLMPRLFMALRQEDRHPISEILYQMPEIPDTCQWAIFLRNHDELTLEMVSDEERDYMYQAYAADPQMRLNAGIRRRLAPLMENSRPRIELLTGLLLSLPGHPRPLLRRRARHGRQRLSRRPQRRAHADAVERRPQRRLLARRPCASLCPADHGLGLRLRRGQRRGAGPIAALAARLDAPDHRAPPASRRDVRPRHARAPAPGQPPHPRVHPPVRGRRSRSSSSRTCRGRCRPSRSTSRGWRGSCRSRCPAAWTCRASPTRRTSSRSDPFAFYWLRLQREAPSNLASRPLAAPVELDPEQSPLLVGPEWWKIFDGSIRALLERRHLAGFLQRQPWFERRASPLTRVTIADWGTLQNGDEPVFVVVLVAGFADGVEQRYIVPVAMTGGERAAAITRETPETVIVDIGGARKGVMHTRLDGSLGRAVVNVMLGEPGGRPARYGRLLADTLRRARGHRFATSGLKTFRLRHSTRRSFRSHATFGERLMLEAEWRALAGSEPGARLPHVPDERGRVHACAVTRREPRLRGCRR